ncbi:Hsp70 family protein [Mycobacterium sp. 852002-30065_SCH5024008]|uniref:Hsp70 family protein n=1 Tax=Mycobacterium sp. 852002-30065_SCH5024008 TaxID=1834088 RepID=UPI0007FE2318|nr:Hsp70 family protein [Mycobacterium sp. 852002-30065_SCH5024008]OBB82807.1 molecular chaperone [Mycobacterium sp. 852002-30065_SCH5024008]
MSESLGLSIGAANLVAARAGRPPVVRSAVLTLFEGRPTEVGLPEENPNLTENGMVLRGFVERVGDRSPLVAADGTKYLGEVLTVEAIEAMARTVGYGTPITIAVPAYWSDAQFTALREEFFAQPDLARGGVAPVLVSDATAALAALRGRPGFPSAGVVALCDFGASGTSVTLMDAGSHFTRVGPTVRSADFSGDAIDQLVLGRLRASDDTMADLGSTVRMGSQSRLLGECRRAKEQLSTAATASVALAPGANAQLSRAELEQLISEPLDRFLGTLEEALRRNGIARGRLAAVAAVGGGAGIPLLAARLSERFQMPVHTPPQPAVSAAIGAAVLGEQQTSAGVPTAVGAVVETPTEMVGTAGIDMTQAASAAQATDVDGALAWSQDVDGGDEPVPYTGRDATGEYSREATDSGYADGDRYAAEEGPLPWYKRTALVLLVAGAAAAVLVAIVLALTLGRPKSHPVNTTPPNTPAPPQTSQTVTITQPNGSTTETVLPPPPPSSPPSSSEQPPTTTTTEPPTTTTTTTPPPTTTTTPPPPTTTAPPTTSQATTTAAPPTTTRFRPLLPPFVPRG